MKKVVIAVLAIGLLLLGLMYALRRRPGELPVGEEGQQAFRVESSGRGTSIRYDDPRTPLRSLRWLPPLQQGVLVVQVATQNDRQQVSLFKDAAFQESYLVPKPQGVRDGFFRLAELRQALVVDGDAAVLLYLVPGSEEPPLVIALDLQTKMIRWTHRAKGERLALAGDAVYLFGAKTPPVRLPLALSDGEKTSAAGARSSAKVVELPPEIPEVADLRPTGSWSFLVVHKGGLSAYLGSKGWLHHPVPEGDPGLFKDIGPALGSDGKRFWWQPSPGHVIQVLADGTPKSTWSPSALPTAPPFARDASLLHLLGADADGKLWFDLAIPTQPLQPAAPPEPEPKPEEPAGTPASPATEPVDWPAYVSQGLDRLYCWDPQKRLLQRFGWSRLEIPQGMPRPGNGTRFLPEAGALLLENGASAWLLPSSALTVGESTNTLKPDN